MKKVKIGVLFTGSIAVVRAKKFNEELKEHFDVIIGATTSAQKIYQNEFGRDIYFDLFSKNENQDVNHIKYFSKCEAIIVYAATYNTINKFANGINDNFLLASLSAFTKNIIFVPAMNTNMYTSEILQENIKKIQNLSSRFHFIDPIVGQLREGSHAIGHVANNPEILAYVVSLMSAKKLMGKEIVVASGSMHSKIDDVRVISNLSSSTFAKYFVQHLKNLGANVIWLDSSHKQVRGVEKQLVKTNQETVQMALKYLKQGSTYISLTAGSDFEVDVKQVGKISSQNNLQLNFIKAEKILAQIQKKLHNKNINYVAFKLSSNPLEGKDLLKKYNCSYVI